MTTAIDTLIAAGHATRTPGPTTRPVTVRNWYRTVDGWNVEAWVGGRANAACVGYGYSDAAKAALLATTEELGPHCSDNERAFERSLLARLGLAEVTA